MIYLHPGPDTPSVLLSRLCIIYRCPIPAASVVSELDSTLVSKLDPTNTISQSAIACIFFFLCGGRAKSLSLLLTDLSSAFERSEKSMSEPATTDSGSDGGSERSDSSDEEKSNAVLELLNKMSMFLSSESLSSSMTSGRGGSSISSSLISATWCPSLALAASASISSHPFLTADTLELVFNLSV